MKRFCCLAVLMVLSSSAYAGESFSFTVGGHRIHIEAPRHCRSASCVSVSIPGVYETRRSPDRYDDRDDASGAVPAKPLAAAPALASASVPARISAPTPAPAPTPASAPAIVARATTPSIQPAAGRAPPSPATVGPTAAMTPQVAAPPPSNVAASPTPPATPSVTPPATPPVTAPIERPPVAASPAAETAKVLKISRDADDQPAQTPLGDWQTEGKTGLVRIVPCGRALCGHILNASSNAVGETVLINMKKASAEWSGNIYSRDSGNTYYATMAMKGPNSLRVEACALGRFFCSGNVWNRINAQPDKLITSSQPSSAPRS
jgi:uncharacterized protein (DUF2147 family)